MGKLMILFVFINCPQVKNQSSRFTIDNKFSHLLIGHHSKMPSSGVFWIMKSKKFTFNMIYHNQDLQRRFRKQTLDKLTNMLPSPLVPFSFRQYQVMFCIHQHSRNVSSEKGFPLHGLCVLEVDMSQQLVGRAESKNLIVIPINYAQLRFDLCLKVNAATKSL